MIHVLMAVDRRCRAQRTPLRGVVTAPGSGRYRSPGWIGPLDIAESLASGIRSA